MCHDILTRGIKKGKTMAREKKCAEGAIVTDKRKIVGAGYTTYGQHHGTSHDKNAALQQGRNTTRLLDEE